MFNKAMLIGRIGQLTPSATKAGKSVMQFTVATTKSYKDKETGDWKELTEWHRCTSFDKVADHLRFHCNPGDLLKVEGELRTRKWEKNGENHYTTEIVVNDFPLRLPRYYTKAGAESSVSTKTNNLDKTKAQNNPSLDEDIPF